MPKKDSILMEGVRLLPGSYRNFAGRKTQYNPEGVRNFCVILHPDTARAMERDGFNVKQTKAREGDDGEELGQEYYIKVMVKYDYKPPRITLMTSRNRTPIGEDTVEMLDYADIEKADLVVNPNHYNINGKTGVNVYLKSMVVIIEEDELDLKYGFSGGGLDSLGDPNADDD